MSEPITSEIKEASSDDVKAVLQNALHFIQDIANDCLEVSRVEGIETNERRTWESVASRCEKFLKLPSNQI